MNGIKSQGRLSPEWRRHGYFIDGGSGRRRRGKCRGRRNELDRHTFVLCSGDRGDVVLSYASPEQGKEESGCNDFRIGNRGLCADHVGFLRHRDRYHG